MTGPIAVAAPSPWDSTPSVWRVPLSRDDLELLQGLLALHARGQRSDAVRARLAELERKLATLRTTA